jgi:hypothetical protein
VHPSERVGATVERLILDDPQSRHESVGVDGGAFRSGRI